MNAHNFKYGGDWVLAWAEYLCSKKGIFLTLRERERIGVDWLFGDNGKVCMCGK